MEIKLRVTELDFSKEYQSRIKASNQAVLAQMAEADHMEGDNADFI